MSSGKKWNEVDIFRNFKNPKLQFKNIYYHDNWLQYQGLIKMLKVGPAMKYVIQEKKYFDAFN